MTHPTADVVHMDHLRGTPPRYASRPPTVYATVTGEPGREQYRIHCPYCRREHRHGPVEGHRVPHCGAPVGYVIRLTKKEAA